MSSGLQSKILEKMTLTKAELADMLFGKVGRNKREANDVVESFYEEIRLALETGESVKLAGFGSFERNPKKGEDGVAFQASAKLKVLTRDSK